MELLIAMGLASLGFVSMLSLQTSVVSAQQRQLLDVKLSGNASYAAEALKRDIRACSAILEPAAGASGNVLKGYVNVSRLDLENPAVAGEPASYFIYCVPPEGNILYKYSGAVPVAMSFTGFVCGGGPSASQKRELIISASEGASLVYTFRVGEHSGNVVNIEYLLLSGKETVKGSLSAQFQRGL
jgi:hypothetical protein